ncbi:RICIN domain-containing protein [Hymenobacter sp. BT683]|uniref:RICIN domain-containing protein n=1 Tax=Hymenobacter jeongseonensis TaxID=2791027 RepID=A0ABS0IDA5_9BACT|nr:RICIN domain-containing protein [Hymenobacter jeongseonensis]MBF9236029.1 RICIN domain-containing protein [Hymenobacter jeongseonensis]
MTKSLLLGSLLAICLTGSATSAWAQGAIVNGGTYKMTHYGVLSGSTTPGADAGLPLCMDVDLNLATAGTSIGQWVDNGNDAQRYIFEVQADGSYKLRHKGTVMYVQPVALGKTAGTQIEQNVLLTTGDDSQRWFITDPNNNGRYKFTLKNSANAAGVSQVLEIGSGSNAPGARVNLWDDNGFEPAQRWELTLITTATATKAANNAALKAEAYPNPAGPGQRFALRVEATKAGAAEIEVLDVLGKKIHSQSELLKTGGNVVSLRGKHLAAGSYVVRVHQGEFTQQTRVVQQ